METMGDHLKLMVKTFRRECHRVLQSERTTIHGADNMLVVLQLAMAEVNKQVENDCTFTVILGPNIHHALMLHLSNKSPHL